MIKCDTQMFRYKDISTDVEIKVKPSVDMGKSMHEKIFEYACLGNRDGGRNLQAPNCICMQSQFVAFIGR